MGKRINRFMMKHFMLMFGGGFLLLGLALIVVGIAAHVSFLRFRETALPAVGVITNIEATRARRKGGSGSHRVYVEYTVDGTVYNRRLSYYTAGMRAGQEVAILYNPEDPGEMRGADGGGWAALLFCGVGTVFSVVGGAGLRFYRKNRLLFKYTDAP